MLGTVELSLEVDSMLELVGAKEALNGIPNSECRGTQLVDEVEDVLCDGSVETLWSFILHSASHWCSGDRECTCAPRLNLLRTESKKQCH